MIFVFITALDVRLVNNVTMIKTGMFSQLLILVLLDSVLAKSLSSNGNEHIGVGRSKRHLSEFKVAEYMTLLGNSCASVNCGLYNIMQSGRRKRRAPVDFGTYLACCG